MPISSRSPYQRYTKSKRVKRLRTLLKKQYKATYKAVAEGCNIVILSDRKQKNGSYSNVIGVFVYSSFAKHSKSSIKFGILIESAEPREPIILRYYFGCRVP
jgi:glutamate synthase (ferredoxin)